MKRFLYIFLLFMLFALPSMSEEKPSVLKEDAEKDAKESLYYETREQIKLYYNTNNQALCLEALSKIPDAEKSAQEWVLMSNIAQDQEKPMDAVFYLQRAILKDPKLYKPYYNLGNIYFENDKINLAMDNYKKSINLKKDFAYGYYNLGCCYLKKGSWRLARYYIGLAIKYYPDEPLFYYNIAYAYTKLNNEKRASDALALYEQLMNK